MTSVFRTCLIHHQPNNPVKLGKHGTVRTSQRTHGVSTYKLHCTAKTAKFFLARKLTAKQVQKHAEHAESYTGHVVTTADHASAKQRASYQVTEHAPTHKGTKPKVPQEPNFHRTTGSRHNWAFRSRARRGVRGETRAACARAPWHTQNGMPREEHLDRTQKSEEQLTQTRKGEELTLSCI